MNVEQPDVRNSALMQLNVYRHNTPEVLTTHLAPLRQIQKNEGIGADFSIEKG